MRLICFWVFPIFFVCDYDYFFQSQDGKSLLEWTQEKAEAVNLSEIKPSLKNELKKEADAAKNSWRVLSEYRPTSVCNDIEFFYHIVKTCLSMQ